MERALRIPEERIGILLGRSGKIKATIEKKTDTKIKVTDEVIISGEMRGVLTAYEIIKAIARGFAPRDALTLLNEENELIVISMSGEKKNTIERLMGRIIGKHGKAKKRIEDFTGSIICVYGKTISIIGPNEGCQRAATAIEQLLDGRSHGYVFKRLEAGRSHALN